MARSSPDDVLTLADLTQKGKMRGQKVCRHWRCHCEAVEAWPNRRQPKQH